MANPWLAAAWMVPVANGCEVFYANQLGSAWGEVVDFAGWCATDDAGVAVSLEGLGS